MTVEQVIVFLVYAVAVWRFTLLIYQEDGPFDMFDWIRFKAGITIEVEQNINEFGKLEETFERKGESFTAKLLNCPYCISGWISLVALLGLLYGGAVSDYIAIWGFIWGIVYLLLRYK